MPRRYTQALGFDDVFRRHVMASPVDRLIHQDWILLGKLVSRIVGYHLHRILKISQETLLVAGYVVLYVHPLR